MAEELSAEVKTFIVQALACFDDPTAVTKAVKEEFAVTVSRQAVYYYDADRKGADEIDQQWRTMFAETRDRFLKETGDIAIANRAVRLRKLDRVARKAEASGNHVLVMDACEAAAKEVGGAFTNRHSHEHSGPNGKPLGTGAVVIPADLSSLSIEQLTQLYREAAGTSSRVEREPRPPTVGEGTVPPAGDAPVRPVGVDVQSEGSGEGTPGVPPV